MNTRYSQFYDPDVQPLSGEESGDEGEEDEEVVMSSCVLALFPRNEAMSVCV